MAGNTLYGAGTGASRQHYLYRKGIEWLAWIGMLFCTGVTVFILLMIFGYVLYQGASYINWEFLTALPLPAGETGGGIANALVGRAMVVAAATLMAGCPEAGGAGFVNKVSRAR